jgi:tRNA threonylcarbamoyladenosine modification (KEOPS) complex  Pcc1 subunit
MHMAILKIECRRPALVCQALRPDVKRDKSVRVNIETGKRFVQIAIQSEKLSYLRATINSYLGLVGMLTKLEG